MTKAERLLMAGLAEAREDLIFVRDRTNDAAMRQMLDSAISVSGSYLKDGIDTAFATHIMEQVKGTK